MTTYFIPPLFAAPIQAFCIEENRVELAVQAVIFLNRHLFPARPSDFGAAQRDRTPVNEHAEAHILPFSE